ncbi:hypothetical protein AWC04_08465 [Mycolicibacterium fallax]|uniref:Uncharacterized protein n=1 Tax=Mycolicibacterium fallax TaxID=1793 RepID=A0A1X1RFK0_MYCFA|nr:hypothetical protein AWC04_08465 [Mycolicibacterium fallax]
MRQFLTALRDALRHVRLSDAERLCQMGLRDALLVQRGGEVVTLTAGGGGAFFRPYSATLSCAQFPIRN